MKKTNKISKKAFGIAYLAAVVFFVSAPHALAYLDPGTGSYIFQVLIGVILGGVYFFKGFFLKLGHKIRQLFSKKENKKHE